LNTDCESLPTTDTGSKFQTDSTVHHKLFRDYCSSTGTSQKEKDEEDYISNTKAVPTVPE